MVEEHAACLRARRLAPGWNGDVSPRPKQKEEAKDEEEHGKNKKKVEDI